MVCFLTSSPCLKDKETLNPSNNFVEELRRTVPVGSRCLFICSDPDNYAFTDGFAESVKRSFNNADIVFSDFSILDSRTEKTAEELVKNADLLILAGGHVPTQNRFFQKVGLKELIKDYDAIVLGISAGTMNSADIVYAQPELPGEAVSPDYKRFLSGLGLTGVSVLPHYQAIKNNVLDGLRVFEDITYPDSFSRSFYALVDGSYIYINNQQQELRGEAYLIENGSIRKISELGGRVKLSD
ncbi:MAG: Type 1 glutamine amidotransferase-like domain-containing protein [Eubacterium sp.]